MEDGVRRPPGRTLEGRGRGPAAGPRDEALVDDGPRRGRGDGEAPRAPTAARAAARSGVGRRCSRRSKASGPATGRRRTAPVARRSPGRTAGSDGGAARPRAVWIDGHVAPRDDRQPFLREDVLDQRSAASLARPRRRGRNSNTTPGSAAVRPRSEAPGRTGPAAAPRLRRRSIRRPPRTPRDARAFARPANASGSTARAIARRRVRDEADPARVVLEARVVQRCHDSLWGFALAGLLLVHDCVLRRDGLAAVVSVSTAAGGGGGGDGGPGGAGRHT